MLGLLGLGTAGIVSSTPFTTPFAGLFRIVTSQQARFSFQALHLALAKVLLRPATLLCITVLTFIVFDLDFDVVREEGDWDDDTDTCHPAIDTHVVTHPA
ncbi:hypothetical protein BGZ70_008827 [Mortierella alpina]|uniref:Uncharacterized protein n=1 Tax=Mortierella alpina TaxID=64518 RepID=A0A9P6J301_MORAP|nr:hypothetical protein BGZ70_008827 [Mortierella alpina]